ncbi:MAG TPA: hypothetical protein VEX86_12065 [Longimicrobium sp.]|nr:hypothetical protein [Longimicrobium sp.]
MTNRVILLMLVLVAGCGPGRPPATWLVPVTDPPNPRVGGRAFWFNRRWEVGDCSLQGGSHVTLTWSNVGMVGLSLTTTRPGAEFHYGITMLAADGTTLAHYPFTNNDRMYVEKNIPVGRWHTRGTNVRITRDIYDRVDRVLIHASC